MLASLFRRKLEIPVKFYPASDVAGIIHGLLGKTLDYASVGPSAYAAMYIDDPKAVEPILTVKSQMDPMGINQLCMLERL